MKVEIWSDVMCPFCYIGKRKFEMALEQFSEKDKVEIIWKSFQLDPNKVTDPNKNVNDYLAERKGISVQKAKEMNDYVTGVAAAVGLNYKLDKAIVANSFDSHRFSHLAKKYGVQNEAEELLFKAYFIEGKNTADHTILTEIGNVLGVDPLETQSVLESDQYADEVNEDIAEAQNIGINGVPFFVFNRKYAVSGAQESKVFLEVLNTLEKELEQQTI